MKKIFSLLTLCICMATAVFADQTVTLKVTVPDSTEVCYATGGFNSWSTDATPMTCIQTTPTKIFSVDVVVPDVVDSGYNYKFLAGPGWNYEQAVPAADFVYGQVGFTNAVVSSFKSYFLASALVDVTVNVMVPNTVMYCYITGSFNSWSIPTEPMTFVSSDSEGRYYTYVIPQVDPASLEFKFLAGPGWAYEQTSSTNYSYAGNGGSDNVVNIICGDFKAIYDPVNVGDVTVNILTYPAGTDSVYLVGSWGSSWKLEEAVACTHNADGTFTGIIEDVAAFEFKCWLRRDWAYEEAADIEGNGLAANRSGSFKTTPVVNVDILFWKATPAGVNTTNADAFNAYIINNTLFVDGFTQSVNIYDVNGRTIESYKGQGTYTSNELRSGIYIIVVDGQSKKFAIK